MRRAGLPRQSPALTPGQRRRRRRLEAGHVTFARQLACQAWAYAVAVERRYRGLPTRPDLPVPHLLAARADTWTSGKARAEADRQEVTA